MAGDPLRTIIPFNNPANFIFDTAKINVDPITNTKLKDIRPVDMLMFADFETNEDANWARGLATGTLNGGATIANGRLNFKGGVVAYCDYDANLNANGQQVGAIRFDYYPNYNGSPTTEYIIVLICEDHNDETNRIFLRHTPGGALRLHSYDKDNILIEEKLLLNPWVVTLGQKYEIEINWDYTAGATRVFIDGVQAGTVAVGTGIRDSNIGLLRFGSNYKGDQSADFEIGKFVSFNTVQHTANYTPDPIWSDVPKTVYSLNNDTVIANSGIEMDGLEGFVVDAILPAGTALRFTAIGNGAELWYNAATLAVETSNGTYAQSSTELEIHANKALFDFSLGYTCKIAKVFLHSNDGSATPTVKSLTVDYNFFKSITNPNKCWLYGYIKDNDLPIEGAEIKINMEEYFHSGGLVSVNETIYSNNIGYYEIQLIETATISQTASVKIKWVDLNGKTRSKKFNIIVPDEVSKRIKDAITT